MEIQFDNQCLDVLRRLELNQSLVKSSCLNRTKGMIIPGNPMQLYAATWHGDGPIIYANGSVTRAQKEGDGFRIQEVTLHLALELRERLPAGDIYPIMNMEQILAVVANSFGLMMSLDPNVAPVRLYTGHWQGNDVSPSMHLAERIDNDECFITGVFKNEDHTCHHVWVFSYTKYRNWFVEGQEN